MEATRRTLADQIAEVGKWHAGVNPVREINPDWERIRTLAVPGLTTLSDYRIRVELGAVDASVYLRNERSANPSPDVIREAHRQMFVNVTTDAGRFRKPSDGNVQFGGRLGVEALRIPVELERLDAEMSELLSQCQTPEDKCAAIAFYHARFISIHPFVDGNGRTGRAIMKCQAETLGLKFDMRPLAVDKRTYVDAINHAREANDIAPLMRVVAQCTETKPEWRGELVSDTKIYGRLMMDFGDVKPLAEERALAKTGLATLPLPSTRGQSLQQEPSF